MWRAQFAGKKHLASDIWEFRFSRPEGYEYLPGQYAIFSFPEPLEDPRGRTRTMSFTSHPHDDSLAFVTRIPAGASLFKQRLSTMQQGETLLVDAALGDLVLPRAVTTPLVFVAGGIGIASYISMLHDMERSGESRSVSLLYALRNHEERLFTELLGRFPFASYGEYVTPNRLDTGTILRTSADESDTLYYLSGTERFVEGLRADLLTLGLTDTQIAFDYFTGY
jgi:benzoate/toluate 1,2-dioxygenase reductase subunit